MSDTITLWNTGVPLFLAGLLAWMLPRYISPPATRSHRTVAIAVGFSALMLVLASAALFAATAPERFSRVAEQAGLFLAIEIAVRGSLLFAIAWGPILALNWFGMAQRVEMWRGKDMAAEDRK